VTFNDFPLAESCGYSVVYVTVVSWGSKTGRHFAKSLNAFRAHHLSTSLDPIEAPFVSNPRAAGTQEENEINILRMMG
jgi:hypothetical protein